jgi:hypothetical protein
VLSWATSAATAQAARLAAIISADYPTLLARDAARAGGALGAMDDADADPPARRERQARPGEARPALRLRRAQRRACLRSGNDALTLVAQSSIRPFAEGKMRELHFFDLPWPRDVLAELGATPVRLRITLSYFIEPNPGRRGWKKRHRYASHGLRFDVKGPTESLEEFRKRLNKKALEEDETKPATGGDSSEWYLGEQARNRGSLHSDILSCNAADLAERGVDRRLPGERLVEGPAEARSQRGRAVRPRRVHRDAGRRDGHLDARRPAGRRAGGGRNVISFDYYIG